MRLERFPYKFMQRKNFLSLAGAAALLPTSVVAQTAPVRIASIPIDTGIEAFFADQLGFFKKAGLNIDLQVIANGAQVTAGVVSGALDIGFANLLPIAQAYERGIPLVAIFPGALYVSDHPNGFLMVAKDSPFQQARDLNGKTVGIPGIGNMTQIAPMAWIDQNGGDYKSVHWVEIPFSALQAALDQHRIDAAFITEPYYSVASQVDRTVANIMNAISLRFLTGVWFATKPWADAHADAIVRFNTAMRETARWANTHRTEAVPLITKYTKVPEAVVAHEPPIVYAEEMSVKDIQPLLDAASKYGFLQRPLAVNEIMYRPAK
jgi:NitT/TauT family transport system substrate-binding protein